MRENFEEVKRLGSAWPAIAALPDYRKLGLRENDKSEGVAFMLKTPLGVRGYRWSDLRAEDPESNKTVNDGVTHAKLIADRRTIATDALSFEDKPKVERTPFFQPGDVLLAIVTMALLFYVSLIERTGTGLQKPTVEFSPRVSVTSK